MVNHFSTLDGSLYACSPLMICTLSNITQQFNRVHMNLGKSRDCNFFRCSDSIIARKNLSFHVTNGCTMVIQ